MKLPFLLIPIIALSTLIGCSNNHGIICKLTGETLDRKEGNLFLYRPESSRFDKDTIPFKNGQFEYEISIDNPEVYWLFFKEDEEEDGVFTPIRIFIEPGNVHVKLSIDSIYDYQVLGGLLNERLFNVEKRIQQNRKESSKLEKFYMENSETIDSITLKKLLHKNDSLTIQSEVVIQKYSNENTDLVSAFYIWSRRQTSEKRIIETQIDSLINSYPNSRYIIETKAFIEGFGKNQQQQHFTDFLLLNTNGKDTQLSEIVENNKATFILFWSSRCGFSDGKLKAFKPIYDEYKDFGFEIIGISNDYNQTRWKKAIERNEANWVNMIDLDGKNAVEEYYHSNTEGDVLIDNSGKILARNVRTSQLKGLLEEILK